MSMCFVSTLYRQSFEIEIDPKETGQVVLNEVLDILDIVEVDFFGLKYVGPKKEELWLNLRNRICDQIIGSTHIFSLKLRVKFFVHPDRVQQEATKELFYLQAKEALSKGHISLAEPHCSEAKLVKVIAFLAQAEHQDQTHNSYQYQTYVDILKDVHPQYKATESVIEKIFTEHSQLSGMPSISAKSFALEELSTVQGYGMEYHQAHTEQGSELSFGVGPDGILLKCLKSTQEKEIPYGQIRLATHNDKCVNIQLNDDYGEHLSEELYKLSSRKAAIALYRCITEMHSFYRCDTVGPDVQTQYCRDLKGTFVSIFNENSQLGKRYVFDIQRTSKEAYDLAQSKLHARGTTSPGNSPLHTASTTMTTWGDLEDEEDEDTDEGLLNKETLAGSTCGKSNKNLVRENKRLKRRLEAMEDALLCCICMYQRVCVVLCPCGHMTCDTCSDRIEQCPQCRTDVEQFQKVFQGFVGNNANKVFQKSDLASSPEPHLSQELEV